MFKLNIIKYPSGRYGFAGRVPIALGFVSKSGKELTEEYIERQLRLPSSYRDIKDRSFNTKECAIIFARSVGIYDIK